jgi:hypothetical protein
MYFGLNSLSTGRDPFPGEVSRLEGAGIHGVDRWFFPFHREQVSATQADAVLSMPLHRLTGFRKNQPNCKTLYSAVFFAPPEINPYSHLLRFQIRKQALISCLFRLRVCTHTPRGLQADAVLSMPLRRLTEGEVGKLEAEHAELQATISDLEV